MDREGQYTLHFDVVIYILTAIRSICDIYCLVHIDKLVTWFHYSVVKRVKSELKRFLDRKI